MRVAPDPWRSREPSARAARQEAIEAGKETYIGKRCPWGHSERLVKDCSCVQCAKEGRRYPLSGPNQERKPDSYGPLGKAHQAWTELQREIPAVPAYKLWGRFLNSLQDDPDTLAAAIEKITPPEPPRRNPKNERSRHEGLTEWAEQNGVFDLETKMRQALHAGRTTEASNLRHEALALMRQGAALVGRQLARGSSLA